MTLEAQQVPLESWASGTVQPLQQAMLAPKIMSTVTEVLVREGDRVRRGQVLARLEASDLAAQARSASAAATGAAAQAGKAAAALKLTRAETRSRIASAEAALAVAREQLSLAAEGARPQERAQAQLALEQAEAQLRNAETERARMQRLHEQGVIPQQRLDSVTTQYEVARAARDIARQQYSIAAEGSRAQEIAAARQRVRQAEEALRLARASAVQADIAGRDVQASAAAARQAKAGQAAAQAMLAYSVIRAPFSGVVTSRSVDRGDTASPGLPILTLQDDSVFRLEATAPQSDAGKLAVGKVVSLEIGPDKRRAVGRIAVVSPAGDPATRKVLVKVNIPKSASPRSGQFGRMMLVSGAATGILVPEAALQEQDGITSVFVVGDGSRSEKRIIRTGRRTEAGVEVTTGLRAGDRLIVEAPDGLRDDVPVAVAEGRAVGR